VRQVTTLDDREVEASRRLTEALDPTVIDSLLADAKAAGTPVEGVDGLLNRMTKAVLERALEAEMTYELGYERGDPAGAGSGNSRNGATRKTISTTNGPVTIEVPRDRNGEFEPRIVPKRARRLGGDRRDDPVAVCAWVDHPRHRGACARGVRCECVAGADLECHRCGE